MHAGYILLFAMIFSFGKVFSQSKDFNTLREEMVERQMKSRGIKNEKVLQAFLDVERHSFVPEKHRSRSYNDTPLPIGQGQTISQPYMVAFMTEVLDLQKSDRVLEIGTGSGYQAAILGELCDAVYTIEIHESLGTKASVLLKELGYDNITVKVGDGYKGWSEYAPFDAIIVTCAPSDIPEPLKNQLAEGGKMIIPVGAKPPQKLFLLTKKNGKVKEQAVLNVAFVPMTKESGEKYE